jgi:hypothetical protein
VERADDRGRSIDAEVMVDDVHVARDVVEGLRGEVRRHVHGGRAAVGERGADDAGGDADERADDERERPEARTAQVLAALADAGARADVAERLAADRAATRRFAVRVHARTPSKARTIFIVRRGAGRRMTGCQARA